MTASESDERPSSFFMEKGAFFALPVATAALTLLVSIFLLTSQLPNQ